MTRVIVIGAGVAGLASAIRLQNEGYQVTIVEKQSHVGGKMNRVDFDGYTFDLGPTIVMMPELYREIFELTGVDADDYIPMRRLDPMYSSYFDHGQTRFEVSNDLVKMREMFESVSEADAAGFLRYLSDLYSRFLTAKDYFLQRSFNRKRDFYNFTTLYQGMKLKTLNSAEKLLQKYISDQRMRQMISFQTLYIGISPHKGPSLYTIIPLIEFVYGVWFIQGGMRTMAESMARRFKEMGGDIQLETPVTDICVSEGIVQGVQTPESRLASDIVLCNADFPYAMKYLLEEPQHKGNYPDKKIDRMDYSCSCLVFYFGMDQKFNALSTVHNFVFSENLDRNIHQIFEGDVITDPSLYFYVASQLDPSLAPEGKDGIYVLMPVSNTQVMKYQWTEAMTDYYRQKVVDKMSELPEFEHFAQYIQSERVTTPKDFEQDFNAYYGATFGLMPTLAQSNHLRPQSKSANVRGLYFTGSSTHPGAGVPIVLLSAKIAVEEILKDARGGHYEK